MITEDYVSFETAKLLKEKGFEYNPDESYWLIGANNTMYWISCIGAYEYVDVPTESFQRPKNGYRLITQATAMKWLREHGWFIHIDIIREASAWLVDVQDIKNDVAIYPVGKEYSSYEEACEAGIKYCLEKLI